jgi:hypothetical protein
MLTPEFNRWGQTVLHFGTPVFPLLLGIVDLDHRVRERAERRVCQVQPLAFRHSPT